MLRRSKRLFHTRRMLTGHPLIIPNIASIVHENCLYSTYQLLGWVLPVFRLLILF